MYSASFSQFIGLMQEYGAAKFNLANAHNRLSGIGEAILVAQEARIALGEFVLKHWKEVDDDHDTHA